MYKILWKKEKMLGAKMFLQALSCMVLKTWYYLVKVCENVCKEENAINKHFLLYLKKFEDENLEFD